MRRSRQTLHDTQLPPNTQAKPGSWFVTASILFCGRFALPLSSCVGTCANASGSCVDTCTSVLSSWRSRSVRALLLYSGAWREREREGGQPPLSSDSFSTARCMKHYIWEPIFVPIGEKCVRPVCSALQACLAAICSAIQACFTAICAAVSACCEAITGVISACCAAISEVIGACCTAVYGVVEACCTSFCKWCVLRFHSPCPPPRTPHLPSHLQPPSV